MLCNKVALINRMGGGGRRRAELTYNKSWSEKKTVPPPQKINIKIIDISSLKSYGSFKFIVRQHLHLTFSISLEFTW